MKTEFVLIDFENVQPRNLEAFRRRSVRIKVFLGGKQTRIPLEIAQAMQAFGPDAEYIQIEGSGSNALDFHIAYTIGRLSAEHPGASFHIVSKDTGFDPLIHHLNAKGIPCKRTIGTPQPAAVKVPHPGSVAEQAETVIGDLARRKAAKPRSLKTLRSTINALFKKELTEGQLDAVIDELARRGALKVTDGKVSYELPS